MLNTNAVSVQLNRGNGQLGLIFLTLSGVVCATLLSTNLRDPSQPRVKPRYGTWNNRTTNSRDKEKAQRGTQ